MTKLKKGQDRQTLWWNSKMTDRHGQCIGYSFCTLRNEHGKIYFSAPCFWNRYAKIERPNNKAFGARKQKTTL